MLVYYTACRGDSMYMKQTSKLFVMALIVVLLSFHLPVGHAQVTEARGTSISFVEQGNLWVKELSLQPQFAKWANAKTSVSPLGPGTHSWLMLVEHETEGTIGYLIIHSDGEGGYILGEYGVGNDEALHTLTEHRTKLQYYNPLHSIIPIQQQKQVQFIEPFSAEPYELNESDLKVLQAELSKQKRHGIQAAHALVTNAFVGTYMSPFSSMPWLTTTSLNDQLIDSTSIENLIELHAELKYTSSIWNDQIETIFSVTAFHEWELFDLYIGLQQENDTIIRYIPFDYLLEAGNFYQSVK